MKKLDSASCLEVSLFTPQAFIKLKLSEILSAIFLKADPCDEVNDYHQVIEIAQGIPVLVRGGGKVSDEEILNRTYALMEQGAKGIVYGRNVIHHANPAGMTKALMAVVHEGLSGPSAFSLIS